MSKRELAESERKKELIRIMEARRKIDDGTDGYMLPDDYITEQGKMDKKKRQNALYQRYTDNKPADGQFVTDVDSWEDAQRDKTNLKTGAMDKEFVEEEYEYVFDDTQKIEFLQDERMGGTLTKEAQEMMARIDELEKKGELNLSSVRSGTQADPQPCQSRKSESPYQSTSTETTSYKPSPISR
jgi:pre-mRNA-splicing factor ATP-dependent RNA helicase DHX16